MRIVSPFTENSIADLMDLIFPLGSTIHVRAEATKEKRNTNKRIVPRLT